MPASYQACITFIKIYAFPDVLSLTLHQYFFSTRFDIPELMVLKNSFKYGYNFSGYGLPGNSKVKARDLISQKKIVDHVSDYGGVLLLSIPASHPRELSQI